MAIDSWKSHTRSVASLHLDVKNPRLGRESAGNSPRDLIQFLFEHDKALDIAKSIAAHGFFLNEPLLAVREKDKVVVVEGNRRLAALKALREPGLLEGTAHRQIATVARSIADISTIAKVPVILAPSRRATDEILASRHGDKRMLIPWTQENRSSFILDKLEDGYTNDQLRDRLGFTLTDIQKARQVRALSDMARSIDLQADVALKVQNPRARFFTTLVRVFDSTAGKTALMIESSPEHGFIVKAKKASFEATFARLVTDVALGHQDSRSLGTDAQIKAYFDKIAKEAKPEPSRRTLKPADFVTSTTVASPPQKKATKPKRATPTSRKVIPPDFKVRHGTDRIKDLRKELGKINRDNLPNAGAMLLRVMLELSMIDYLKRKKLYASFYAKQSKKFLNGEPTMRSLAAEFKGIAENELADKPAKMVKKALTYDAHAPFTIPELNGFAHTDDVPSGRDIQQFWTRTRPLFELMLTDD